MRSMGFCPTEDCRFIQRLGLGKRLMDPLVELRLNLIVLHWRFEVREEGEDGSGGLLIVEACLT